MLLPLLEYCTSTLPKSPPSVCVLHPWDWPLLSVWPSLPKASALPSESARFRYGQYYLGYLLPILHNRPTENLPVRKGDAKDWA